MSLKNKPIPRPTALRLQEYPCDGIARFKVKKLGTGVYPYSAAYAGILASTGCSKNEHGQRVYTPDGIRRITKLNDAYLSAARAFITNAIIEQNALTAAVSEQLTAGEKNESPPPDPAPASQ